MGAMAWKPLVQPAFLSNTCAPPHMHAVACSQQFTAQRNMQAQAGPLPNAQHVVSTCSLSALSSVQPLQKAVDEATGLSKATNTCKP